MLAELVDSLIQSVSQWINNLPKSNIKCYNNSRVIEVVDSLIQAVSQWNSQVICEVDSSMPKQVKQCHGNFFLSLEWCYVKDKKSFFTITSQCNVQWTD